MIFWESSYWRLTQQSRRALNSFLITRCCGSMYSSALGRIRGLGYRRVYEERCASAKANDGALFVRVFIASFTLPLLAPSHILIFRVITTGCPCVAGWAHRMGLLGPGAPNPPGGVGGRQWGCGCEEARCCGGAERRTAVRVDNSGDVGARERGVVWERALGGAVTGSVGLAQKRRARLAAHRVRPLYIPFSRNLRKPRNTAILVALNLRLLAAS